MLKIVEKNTKSNRNRSVLVLRSKNVQHVNNTIFDGQRTRTVTRRLLFSHLSRFQTITAECNVEINYSYAPKLNKHYEGQVI